MRIARPLLADGKTTTEVIAELAPFLVDSLLGASLCSRESDSSSENQIDPTFETIEPIAQKHQLESTSFSWLDFDGPLPPNPYEVFPTVIESLQKRDNTIIMQAYSDLKQVKISPPKVDLYFL